MIEKLDDNLVGIAIGIRFTQNFSIQDHYGSIADKILYSENSLFGPVVFPKLTTPPSEQLILINEENEDKFVFDKSNVILEINFSENSAFSQDKLKDLINAYEDQVIKGILKELSISRLVRVGYIRKYQFDDNELLDSLVSRVSGDVTQKINDINIRFSKRIPLGKSVALREKNDYKNSIFTIIKKSDQDNKIIITVDYQRFYVPKLSTSSQIKFKTFIEEAESFNSQEVLKWLNNYYLEVANE